MYRQHATVVYVILVFTTGALAQGLLGLDDTGSLPRIQLTADMNIVRENNGQHQRRCSIVVGKDGRLKGFKCRFTETETEDLTGDIPTIAPDVEVDAEGGVSRNEEPYRVKRQTNGYYAHPMQMDRNPGVATQPGVPQQPGMAPQPGVPQQPGMAPQPGVPQHQVMAQLPGAPQQPAVPQQQGVAQQPGVPQQQGVAQQPGVPQQQGVAQQPGVPQQQGVAQQPGVPQQQGVATQPGLAQHPVMAAQSSVFPGAHVSPTWTVPARPYYQGVPQAAMPPVYIKPPQNEYHNVNDNNNILSITHGDQM